MVIISAYWVGKQPMELGTCTVYAQQCKIMQSQDSLNPNLHKQFIISATWSSGSYEMTVLVCLDANKDAACCFNEDGIQFLMEYTSKPCWPTSSQGSFLINPTSIQSSIKLKIDERVGASLLELEFDWHSRIPTEDMSVIISTDRLLKKSTTINFQIDLSVQFVRVHFFQRWTALNVRYYALFQ